MSWKPKNKEDRPDKVRYTEYTVDGRNLLRIFFPNTCNNWIDAFIKSLPDYYDLIESRQVMFSITQGVVLEDTGRNNITWAWKVFMESKKHEIPHN